MKRVDSFRTLVGNLFKLAGVVLTIMLLINNSSVLAQSFTQGDLNSIIGGTPFYDPNATQCASLPATTTTSENSGATSGSWTSNAQPPYYLEAFAINLLEDVAQKTNVPQNSAVTQEHVVALIAWFWVEGGDINNNDLFNPLNTGINDPTLIAGSNNGAGLQSFKSFDDGVEATARTIVGSNQTRIAQALTNQSTTAEQFIQALTYYQNYPGNAYWATADDQSVAGAQQKYYNTLLASVEQARSNYATEAATILGTPAHEAALGERVPTSELKFSGGTDNAGSASTTLNSTGSCAGISCNNSSSATTSITNPSQVRQNVVCIAQQELALWKAQPGYPWSGSNQYAETGYLKYSQNRPEEWCADFASWVYDQAGYPLKPDPNWNTSSVAQIQTIGAANQNFHWHPENSYTPQPGDLAIYSVGQPDSHVNIVISVSGNVVTFIGGDQGNGPYPGGSIVSTDIVSGFHGQGIIGYVSPT